MRVVSKLNQASQATPVQVSSCAESGKSPLRWPSSLSQRSGDVAEKSELFGVRRRTQALEA